MILSGILLKVEKLQINTNTNQIKPTKLNSLFIFSKIFKSIIIKFTKFIQIFL
jgi:hypothetical protein